jgi:hypothetical protein
MKIENCPTLKLRWAKEEIMKKIAILLGIFLCMQYKAAIQEVIKAADQLKILSKKDNKSYDDFSEIYQQEGTIIKNLMPAWEEATKTEVDYEKYGLIINLVKSFVEKKIIQQSHLDLGYYFDNDDKYLGEGNVWNGESADPTTKKHIVFQEKIWNLWTPQRMFLKYIIEYIKTKDNPNNFPEEIIKKGLRQNIEVLACFPEEDDTEIKDYKYNFVSLWGIENIEKFVNNMSYSDYYLNILNKQKKQNIFIYLTNFLTEKYKDNKDNKYKQVLIEAARYLYGLDNTTDLDSIFAGVDDQGKNEIIKQIKEWPMTHIVRKNPKKTAAAGILATILTGLGIYKAIEYFKGKK